MTIRPLCVVIVLLSLTFSAGRATLASAPPASPAASPPNTAKLTPTDLSTIRGANYRGAGAADTTDYWRNYKAAETERDLTYADRLKLNHCASSSTKPRGRPTKPPSAKTSSTSPRPATATASA